MSIASALHFEFASGCLIVRATGNAKFEQRIEFAEAIAAALKKQPVSALLLNLRDAAGPASFMERYELGELAARYLPKIPIAVLMREDQTDKELIGRQVARNRGADLEVLLEPADAEAWLKKHAKHAV